MKTKKEVSKSVSSREKLAKTKKAATKTTTRTKAASVRRVAVKSKPAAQKMSKVSSAKKHTTISAPKKISVARKVGKRRMPSFKRMVYMAFSVVLGLLIGTFVQLFIELVYMRRMLSVMSSPQINYFMGMPSYLPSFVQGFFLLTGLVFGVWLGFWGWRFVYIEKRHRSTRGY